MISEVVGFHFVILAVSDEEKALMYVLSACAFVALLAYMVRQAVLWRREDAVRRALHRQEMEKLEADLASRPYFQRLVGHCLTEPMDAYSKEQHERFIVGTAQDVLGRLVVFPRPVKSSDGVEIGDSNFSRSGAYPGLFSSCASFDKAVGEISEGVAVAVLAHALHARDRYWFNKYATNDYVSSDANVVWWQTVETFENSEDRTCFNGLWDWQIRRINANSFWISLSRRKESGT